MKVLLVYPWLHHKNMMCKLAEEMKKHGITSDILCIANLSLINNSHIFAPQLFFKFGMLLRIIKPLFLSNILVRLYEKYILTLFLMRYDKVDFHSYMDFYQNLIEGCINKKIEYDITVWGSDVLRATEEDFDKREIGYENCTCIRGIDKLLNRLSEVYNKRFDGKMIPAYLGNTNYPVIENLSLDSLNSVSRNLGINTTDKINVLCGYNASPSQQHSIIIDAITDLSLEAKDKIKVIVPMTYDLQLEYLNKIEEKLKTTGVEYLILNKFLNPEELAVLRTNSQILIDMQVSDAFSGALQDTLFCENVVIVADWLNYPPYDRNNVFYKKTSQGSLSKVIEDVVLHYLEYKMRCKGNREKLRNISSWDCCIKQWVKATLKRKEI